MIGTLWSLASGGYANLSTIRFFLKSGLFRRSRPLFQVTIHKRTKLTLGKVFSVEGDGTLHVGDDRGHFPRGTSSSLRIGDRARILLSVNQRLFSGHQIDIGPGASISFGGGYINHDAKISCYRNITIGRGTIIGEDAVIMDTDHHELLGPTDARCIAIGNHVWIGARAMILKNTKLGDGVVVAAGAIASGEFPPGSLIAGVPAKIVRQNVEWA